mmetsp:Transcript_3287/g.6243  ORF Transcript_3287/g.6243 Transcript_3287/m.6243 type:complete len:257 (-) Transcript_3287:800-1570(-)
MLFSCLTILQNTLNALLGKELVHIYAHVIPFREGVPEASPPGKGLGPSELHHGSRRFLLVVFTLVVVVNDVVNPAVYVGASGVNDEGVLGRGRVGRARGEVRVEGTFFRRRSHGRQGLGRASIIPTSLLLAWAGSTKRWDVQRIIRILSSLPLPCLLLLRLLVLLHPQLLLPLGLDVLLLHFDLLLLLDEELFHSQDCVDERHGRSPRRLDIDLPWICLILPHDELDDVTLVLESRSLEGVVRRDEQLAHDSRHLV